MNNLRFIIAICLLTVTPFLSAQADEKWTLEKCVDYAFKNNIQVRQAELTAKVSGNENLQSKLNLLPSVDGNINFSNNFGNGFNPQTYSFAQGTSQSLQASLQGTLPVFTGLQQIYNIERTKYDLLASKYDFENAKNNVALSVASSYLQVLLNKEILKVAQKQKELTELQRNTIAAKIRSGSLPETAAYEVESQLGRDEANIVGAQNAVDLSLLALRQLLQITDSKFDVDAPEVNVDDIQNLASVSSQSVYEYALGNQPSIKSAEARVQSANSSRKISLGALSPTIAVFGTLSTGYFSQDKKVTGYTTQVDSSLGFPIPYKSPLYGDKTFNEHLSNNFRKAIGVSMNIPLFSKWQRVTNIQNAKLQMQVRELQLEGNKNQLRQDIELAYTNAKAAVQSYMANSKSVLSAQKSYDAFDKRFGAGLLGNFELQQSKNALALSQSEMIKAKYTYVFRLKVLDFYQGKPLTLSNSKQ